MKKILSIVALLFCVLGIAYAQSIQQFNQNFVRGVVIVTPLPTSTATKTYTPSITPTPTNTPTPTVTNTPINTPAAGTATWTNTPTNTITQTPTATATTTATYSPTPPPSSFVNVTNPNGYPVPALTAISVVVSNTTPVVAVPTKTGQAFAVYSYYIYSPSPNALVNLTATSQSTPVAGSFTEATGGSGQVFDYRPIPWFESNVSGDISVTVNAVPTAGVNVKLYGNYLSNAQ